MADQTPDQAAQARAKATEEQKENAKKVIAEQRQAREQRMAEAPEGGKPTPTQEENDLAAMGVHIPEHEPDGSPEQETAYIYPDQLRRDPQHKQGEAKKPSQQGGQYQTRQAQPAPPKPAES